MWQMRGRKKEPTPEHYPTKTSVGRVPEIANSVQMNATQLEEDDPNYDTAIDLAGYDIVAYRSPPSANHHEDNRG